MIMITVHKHFDRIAGMGVSASWGIEVDQERAVLFLPAGQGHQCQIGLIHY